MACFRAQFQICIELQESINSSSNCESSDAFLNEIQCCVSDIFITLTQKSCFSEGLAAEIMAYYTRTEKDRIF